MQSIQGKKPLQKSVKREDRKTDMGNFDITIYSDLERKGLSLKYDKLQRILSAVYRCPLLIMLKLIFSIDVLGDS